MGEYAEAQILQQHGVDISGEDNPKPRGPKRYGCTCGRMLLSPRGLEDHQKALGCTPTKTQLKAQRETTRVGVVQWAAGVEGPIHGVKWERGQSPSAGTELFLKAQSQEELVRAIVTVPVLSDQDNEEFLEEHRESFVELLETGSVQVGGYLFLAVKL
jgi:hypothetical protein